MVVLFMVKVKNRANEYKYLIVISVTHNLKKFFAV